MGNNHDKIAAFMKHFEDERAAAKLAFQRLKDKGFIFESPPTLLLTEQDIGLIRQWFEVVQDVSPEYLNKHDYELAKKVYEAVGLVVPNSVKGS